MGAWGTGIFDSDNALNVRDLAGELLRSGELPAYEITERLIDRWGVVLSWPGEAAEFWAVLALVLAEHGQLTCEARDRALAEIDRDAGANADPYDDPAERLGELRRVRSQIASL